MECLYSFWELLSDDDILLCSSSSSSSSKMRWLALQKLSGYSPLARAPFDPPRPVAIGCFYISVFLFFESAWVYFSHLYQQDSEGEYLVVGGRKLDCRCSSPIL